MSWWTDNAPPGGSQSLHDAVAQIYQTALGRAASEQEIQQTIAGGSGDLASIQKSIYASPEALAYSQSQTDKGNAAKTPAGPPTGGSLTDPAYARSLVDYYASQPGANPSLKNDPDYWVSRMTQVGGDQGYWVSRFMQPEGAPEGSGGGGGNPSGNPLPYSSYGGIGSTPQPYVAPTWTGGPAPTAQPLIPFTAPTLADLKASPGYNARLDAGLLAGNRSAAARGSVLNGGTQQALAQYGQDYASNEYSNLFGQDLATNQNNNSVIQGNYGNAYNTYMANYGQFQNSAAMGYNAYQANVNNTRNASNDYWGQLNQLYSTGANLAGSSYKPSSVP